MVNLFLFSSFHLKRKKDEEKWFQLQFECIVNWSYWCRDNLRAMMVSVGPFVDLPSSCNWQCTEFSVIRSNSSMEEPSQFGRPRRFPGKFPSLHTALIQDWFVHDVKSKIQIYSMIVHVPTSEASEAKFLFAVKSLRFQMIEETFFLLLSHKELNFNCVPSIWCVRETCISLKFMYTAR